MRLGYFPGSEYSLLFEFIKQKAVDVQWVLLPLDGWREEKCLAYFLSQDVSAEILGQATRLSSEVRSTGACDLLVREKETLWPHNILAEVLQELVVEKAPKLDTQAFAYVTGVGPWARTVIAELIQMGYSKLCWVADDVAVIQPAVAQMRDAFFGVQLYGLPSDDLTLQANNGSLLVNTISESENPEFVMDLAYFNFVKRGGLVVDLHLEPEEKSLLYEAGQVGIFTLNGSEVAIRWWNRFLTQFMDSAAGQGMQKHLPELNIDAKEFETFLKSRPSSS